MDTEAYLRRQGWRGDGHALSASGNGIKKPLLISKKVDVLGVGLNKHAAVSDQWWMRAFDQGLKDLGTGKRGALNDVREKGIHFGGLYGRFVKGETVQGTIKEQDSKQKQESESSSDEMSSKKRKQIRRQRKAEKSRKKEEKLRESGVTRVKKAPGPLQIRKRFCTGPLEAFKAEAIRRSLLAPNPLKPISNYVRPVPHPENVILQVFENAGLTTPADTTKTGKGAKISREKNERALKREVQRFVLANLTEDQRREMDEAEERGPPNPTPKKRKIKTAVSDVNDTVSEPETDDEEESSPRSSNSSSDSSSDSDDEPPKKKQKLKEGKKQLEATEIVEDEPKRKTKKELHREKRALKKALGKENDSSLAHQNLSAPSSGGVGFIVDSIGDETLPAMTIAADDSMITVFEDNGEVRWTGPKAEPVPMDPTIWDGVTVKTLPKLVRKARKEWMRQRREARKGLDAGAKAPISRSQRKAEQRRDMAMEILRRSRKMQKNGEAGQAATAEASEGLPILKLESSRGIFTPDEMSRARRAARKELKKEKTAERSGKKSKKRQR